MTTKKPYKVVVDTMGCRHYQSGKTWSVMQPDGALLGTSWSSKSDADEIADLMNRAYTEGAKGRQAGG